MKRNLLILLSIFLVSCSSNSTSSSEMATRYVSHYNDYLISYSSIFNQEESEYKVYVYSPYCHLCNLLVDYTDSYLINHDEENNKFKVVDIYLENESEMRFVEDRNYEDLIGCSNISDFYLISTPVLFTITNNQITNVIYHYDLLVNFFSQNL